MELAADNAHGQPTQSEASIDSNIHAPIPLALQGEVDPTTWGKLTEFDNLESPTPKQVSGHIGFLIECWREKRITAQELWFEFVDEFREWDKDKWVQVPPRVVKYLRTYLLTNGVFVETDGAQITANLERIAKQPDFRPWTTDEVNTQASRNVEFRQNMKNPEFASDIRTASTPWQPPPTPALQIPPTPQSNGHTPAPWLPGPQHQGQQGASSLTLNPYHSRDTTVPTPHPPTPQSHGQPPALWPHKPQHQGQHGAPSLTPNLHHRNQNTMTPSYIATQNPARETIQVIDPASHRDDTPEQVPMETPQPKRGRGRLRKIQPQSQVSTQETDALETFLSSKEQADAALAVQLRAEGKINTPSIPSKKSTRCEIDALITQAYVQSETILNCKILAYLPPQIRHRYPERTVMQVIKPPYRIVKAGTYWWATYHNHRLKKLQMTTSTYDLCPFFSSAENPEFACIGMQTNNTLGLSTPKFSQHKDEQLKEAAFSAKPKQTLTADEPLLFNGGIISLDGDTITLQQKGQAKRLRLIDASSSDTKQQYVEQRARGAYIASICQPEACFDLSSAAQHQDPTLDDIKALNHRIQWQMEFQDHGITFVPLDLSTAKLFVFVDGSFANNRDLTSQLGFVIVLANEAAINDHNEFTIRGNLIHFSSTKSKRVTHSVLASEVYGMVAGVDMAYAIASTLRMITARLNLLHIPTIVCTDSYSLYECLVKLGTTKEKRLMIDIMALRQSYERRELQEVRWIHGDDNLADAFTKGTPNRSLERFIDSNEVTIRVEGWVSRQPQQGE
jgi:hypothetical protein